MDDLLQLLIADIIAFKPCDRTRLLISFHYYQVLCRETGFKEQVTSDNGQELILGIPFKIASHRILQDGYELTRVKD